MNQKIILLTKWGLTGNYKYDRWFAVFFALSMAVKSFEQFEKTPLELWNIGLGLLFASGVYFFLRLALVAYSPNNKYAPKFEITDDHVFLRQVMFQRPVTFTWKEISAIEMTGTTLVFALKDGSRKIFKLNTSEKAISNLASYRLLSKSLNPHWQKWLKQSVS